MRFWLAQRFSAATTNAYLHNLSFRPEPRPERSEWHGAVEEPAVLTAEMETSSGQVIFLNPDSSYAPPERRRSRARYCWSSAWRMRVLITAWRLMFNSL